MFGSQELIIIGIIVVILFGATKLPKLGSGMGEAIRNFKKGISEATKDTSESEEIEAPKESSKEDSSKEE